MSGLEWEWCRGSPVDLTKTISEVRGLQGRAQWQTVLSCRVMSCHVTPHSNNEWYEWVTWYGVPWGGKGNINIGHCRSRGKEDTIHSTQYLFKSNNHIQAHYSIFNIHIQYSIVKWYPTFNIQSPIPEVQSQCPVFNVHYPTLEYSYSTFNIQYQIFVSNIYINLTLNIHRLN